MRKFLPYLTTFPLFMLVAKTLAGVDSVEQIHWGVNFDKEVVLRCILDSQERSVFYITDTRLNRSAWLQRGQQRLGISVRDYLPEQKVLLVTRSGTLGHLKLMKSSPNRSSHIRKQVNSSSQQKRASKQLPQRDNQTLERDEVRTTRRNREQTQQFGEISRAKTGHTAKPSGQGYRGGSVARSTDQTQATDNTIAVEGNETETARRPNPQIIKRPRPLNEIIINSPE